jgi:hypothetical protein
MLSELCGAISVPVQPCGVGNMQMLIQLVGVKLVPYRATRSLGSSPARVMSFLAARASNSDSTADTTPAQGAYTHPRAPVAPGGGGEGGRHD